MNSHLERGRGNPVSALVQSVSGRARKKRGEIFRDCFALTKQTKILDLGSENGAYIRSVLEGTDVDPANVYIADIDPAAIEDGNRRYRFNPVLISESKPLPFPEHFFDVVHCSSVIEHVTIPKNEIWTLKSGRIFQQRSLVRQQEFAKEVMRLGAGYFVQTPYRYFPVETHSWLPFAGWIPRPFLIPTLAFTNRTWVKKTAPDWHLLTIRQLSAMFPEALIVKETYLGFVKSIIAVKRPSV